MPPRAFICSLIALVSVLAVSCTGSSESRDAELVGAWQEWGVQRGLEFSADGTFDHLVTGEGGAAKIAGEGKWRTANGLLELELTSGTMSWLERTAVSPSTISWRFEISGTTMVAEPAFGPKEQVRYVGTGPP